MNRLGISVRRPEAAVYKSRQKFTGYRRRASLALLENVLLSSLVVVFFAANISKWFIDIGFRINYYVPILIIWSAGAALYIFCTKAPVSKGIRTLILLKVIYVGCMLITLPMVVASSQPESMAMYLKGTTMAIVNAGFIVVMLLFLSRLDEKRRGTVINAYLWAVVAYLGYNLAQILGAYVYGVDLDILVTRFLPLWGQEVPSLSREAYGLGGTTFFRFNGLAGDPNVNGVIILMAVPVVLLCGTGKGTLVRWVLTLTCLGVILLTLSNTAFILTLLTLVVLGLRHGRRARKLVLLVLGCAAGFAVYLAARHGEMLDEIVHFRWEGRGTAFSHLEIGDQALALWYQHPLGVGVNNFAVYAPDTYSAHNSYLQTLVELGPLGVMLALIWILYCLQACYREKTNLGRAALMSVGILALAAMGHDMLYRFEFQLIVHVLVALALLSRHERWRMLAAAIGQERPVPNRSSVVA